MTVLLKLISESVDFTDLIIIAVRSEIVVSGSNQPKQKTFKVVEIKHKRNAHSWKTASDGLH